MYSTVLYIYAESSTRNYKNIFICIHLLRIKTQNKKYNQVYTAWYHTSYIQLSREETLWIILYFRPVVKRKNTMDHTYEYIQLSREKTLWIILSSSCQEKKHYGSYLHLVAKRKNTMDHTYIQLSREKTLWIILSPSCQEKKHYGSYLHPVVKRKKHYGPYFHTYNKRKPQNSGKGERNLVLFGLGPKKYFSTTLINNTIVDEKKHPSPYRYSVN